MAETTTDTTETKPTAHAGRCALTLIDGPDACGYFTTVEWTGEQVTTTRNLSRQGVLEVTTERDTVTENALLSLIVPGARPPADFTLILQAADLASGHEDYMRLRVSGGAATIERGGGGVDAALPAWFLSALRDLVLTGDDDGERV